jgi:hypothetical protein
MIAQIADKNAGEGTSAAIQSPRDLRVRSGYFPAAAAH